MAKDIIFNKEKLISILINNTPIAYIIMDDLNRIHYVNESFLKLRGLEMDKTIGEVCYNISNGGKHCTYCSISDAIQSGSKTMLQRKDILPNGTVRYIDDYAIPLYQDSKSGRTFLLEIMINRSEEMAVLEQCNSDLENLVKSLILILQAKDIYTAQHSKNVQKYATKIARQLALSESEILHISLAALLHDLGKLQIPLDIINKPGKLTDEEFGLIKSHPLKAYDLLTGLTDLTDIQNMVRHHHERIDGNGYPDKIPGNQLDLGSKILAVADTYDAMTTDRSYRKALSRELALEELKRVVDTQLDSEIVDVFSSIPAEELENEQTASPPNSLLVRTLKEVSINDVQKDLVVELNELQDSITTDQMIKIIFDNTPCGYVLAAEDNTILFANDFVLSLFGFSEDDFIGKECSVFNPLSVDEKRSGCVRMRRVLPAGNRIFDLFEVPLSDNGESFKMYTILDRTEEVSKRDNLHKNYLRLLQILQDLINQELEGADMSSYEQLVDIKAKAEAISYKFNIAT